MAEMDFLASRKRRLAPLRPEDYEGREQTYAKHFLLRRYLQALVFKLLHSFPARPFLFIDAFSGPWRERNDEYADTSFGIALSVLTDAVETMRLKGHSPDVRAIFVEKNKNSHAELAEAVRAFPLIKSDVLLGQFEDCLPDVSARVRDAFAFVFVDPTGWSGMPIPKLGILLNGRNREVLVNIMAYAIGRHVGDTREIVRDSFNELFGDATWWDELQALRAGGQTVEEAFRRLYLKRLQAACHFTYATTTRILWPGKHRTYFHLAYGTNSPAGLRAFRDAEERCVEEQEQIAHRALIEKAATRAQTADLFAEQEPQNDVAFRAGRAEALQGMHDDFSAWLARDTPASEYDVLASLMQRPLVWHHDCAALLKAAEQGGVLVAEVSARGRLLKPVGSRL